MSGKTLLPILLGAALGISGWIDQKGSNSNIVLERQLEIAEEQLVLLEQENASLRSLANDDGKILVPPELIAKVEKDYGISFLKAPVFHRTSSNELALRIEAAFESRYGPQGIEDRQEAYRWIGWLGEEDVLLEQLVAVRSVGALGWFDEETSEAWLTERFDLKNIPDQATMIRLLVRILLNQHFPASDIHPGDDVARAREAIHAGAASGAETRYYATGARSIGFLPKVDSSATARLMLTLSDFVKGVSVFSSTAGKNFTDIAYSEGREKLLNVLRKPPTQTLGIVLPHQDAISNRQGITISSNDIYLEESAGYLGLLLWISKHGDPSSADQLAQSWRGDRYVLFADGDASSALVWELHFSDKDATDTFFDIAAQFCSNKQKDRFLGTIRTSDTSVRFYNTSTKASAERLAVKN